MDRPRRSVLPEPVREAAECFGAEYARGHVDEAALAVVLRGLDALPAAAIARAESDLVAYARLQHGHPTPSFPQNLLPQTWMLRSTAGLEHLFVFHRVGQLREASLDKIRNGLASPFAFAAVATRLNDWVPEVRAAAVRCAKRVFPETAAAIVAEAALVLLERRRGWRRWKEERGPLDTALERADVVAHLASVLATRSRGHLCTVLRQALRDEGMDGHLPRLARSAVEPAVRGMAMRCLIEGRARWQVGRRKVWIDQVYGLYRTAPVLEERPIVRPGAVRDWIEEAVRDRSASVRKAGADGLVLHRADLDRIDELVERLLYDRSASVRECARFVQKEREAR